MTEMNTAAADAPRGCAVVTGRRPAALERRCAKRLRRAVTTWP